MLEAEVDGLHKAEAAVDDLYAGDAIEAVAYGAAAGRGGRLWRALHAHAKLCCVGSPKVPAVTVDAEVVVLSADADKGSKHIDCDHVVVVAAAVAHGTLQI